MLALLLVLSVAGSDGAGGAPSAGKASPPVTVVPSVTSFPCPDAGSSGPAPSEPDKLWLQWREDYLIEYYPGIEWGARDWSHEA